MPTTTAITICSLIDASTTNCTTTAPAILGTFTYGEVLIVFFLFIIMLGLTFSFIINHFIKK